MNIESKKADNLKEPGGGEVVVRRLGQGSVQVVVGKSDLLARGPCFPPSKHCNEKVLICFGILYRII